MIIQKHPFYNQDILSGKRTVLNENQLFLNKI